RNNDKQFLEIYYRILFKSKNVTNITCNLSINLMTIIKRRIKYMIRLYYLKGTKRKK
ncbi:hypothetical protein GLOIN_2v1710548, partial [Rhizophagus irregularis DAOM 181602=DAOM 197198]